MSISLVRLSSVRQRLAWEILRCWDSLDSTALIALALLALWLGLHFTVNRPLRQESWQLAQYLAGAEWKMVDLAASERRGGIVSASHDMRTFFPEGDGREDQLRQLHQLAQQHGLLIMRADFRTETVAGLDMERFSVSLSLQGSYARQRQFLHTLLANFPNLSVTRISMEVIEGGPDSMNAKLDANLYYRAPRERSPRV